MTRKSYSMYFRAHSRGDMQKLHLLCGLLRNKKNCFAIIACDIRGVPGYEVFWYIKAEEPVMTLSGRPDRRFH